MYHNLRLITRKMHVYIYIYICSDFREQQRFDEPPTRSSHFLTDVQLVYIYVGLVSAKLHAVYVCNARTY